MNATTAKLFDKTEAQLEAIHQEIGQISKRKPDESLNEFKVALINDILAIANQLLTEKYKPLQNFELLSSSSLPTASDVVFICAQYLKAMDEFRFDHTFLEIGECYWRTDSQTTRIKTKISKKHGETRLYK